jgi:hypothetical protein
MKYNISRPSLRSEEPRCEKPSLVTMSKNSDTPPLARRLNNPLGFIYSRKKDKDSRLEFAFLFAMC